MRRSVFHYLIVPALLALSAACGNDLTTTPTDTTPPPTTTTLFSGTLERNGAVTHPFATARSGSVTVTLSTLNPDTLTIGLSLGTWNGESCQTVIARDSTVVGNSIVGTASSSGNFCIRVYDAAGTLTEPTSYDVQVVHP